MLLFCALFMLSAWQATAMAACSGYKGDIVINEYNYIVNFIELKILDGSVLTSTSNLDGWELNIFTKNGKKNTKVDLTNVSNDSNNSCGPASVYIELPFTASQMADEANVVLADDSGNIVDVFRVSKDATPSSYYSGYNACDIGTLPYPTDAPRLTDSGHKDYGRLPDGIGDWIIMPGTGANSMNTLCGSNEAVLELTKTPSAAVISSGDDVTYTITVTNGSSNETQNNVVITEPFPAGLTYQARTVSAGSTNTISPGTTGPFTLTWSIPTLAASATATMTVTATVTAASGSNIINTISGTSDEISPAEVETSATITVGTSLDHYQLSLPSASVSCMPTAVTVTACADGSSPCTNVYTTDINGKTASLSASAGVLGSGTVTFDASGTATTTLSHPAVVDGAGVTVTLSGEQVAAANARECCPDGTGCAVANSCTTTFSSAGLIFSASADGPATTIAHQTAGTASSTYYLRAVKTGTETKACEAALTGTSSVDWAYECNNPVTCSANDLLSVDAGTPTTIARNDNGSVSNYAAVDMTFDANGNAPFDFFFNDVGLLTFHVNTTVNSALLTGTSNAFVSKPSAFVLSDIKQTAAPQLANPAASSSSDPKFVKAGEDFTATVTAVTSGGIATPNFGNETAAESVQLTPNLILPASGNLGSIGNDTVAGTDFSNGVATVSNLSWDEVGIITLTPAVADGDYLSAGNVSGTTTGNIGRFIPDHFAVSAILNNRADLACASTFSYMDEPFQLSLTLTAENTANTTTENYATASGFAKLDPATAAWLTLGTANSIGTGAIDGTTTPLTSRLLLDTSIATPSGSWTAGVGSFSAYFHLSRPVTASADSTWGAYESLNLGISPQDSDDVTVLAGSLDLDADSNAVDERVFVATTKARYGRVTLENAYGSELLDLAMPMSAQYWNGSDWVLNADDTCTSGITLSLTDPVASDGLIPAELCVWDTGSPGNSGLGCTTPAAANKLFAEPPLITDGGNFNLNFKAPGSGNTGALDVTASVSDYLKFDWRGSGDTDPTARASFGVYKGNNPQIYFRELY